MMFSSRILAGLLAGSAVVLGGETIKIQQGDVEIDVQERKDGSGGIEIDIMNTADHHENMFVQDVEDDMQDTTSCDDAEDCSSCDDVDDCCSGADDDVFMAIQLDIQVDYNFHHNGKYRLGLKDDDDDDDDSAAKLYWDVDGLDTGYRYIETRCLPRTGCYTFNIYGKNKAFEFDVDEDDIEDPLGYAKVYIDSGSGFEEELTIDDKFSHEHLEFGCGCDDDDDSCV